MKVMTLYVSLICVTFLSANSVKTYENGKLFTVCSITLWVDFFISVPEYNSIYYKNEKVFGQRRSIP